MHGLTASLLVVSPMATGGGQLVACLTDCKQSQHTSSHLIGQPCGGGVEGGAGEWHGGGTGGERAGDGMGGRRG